MNLGIGLLLIAGVMAPDGIEETHFDNYGDAYRAAKELGWPLLVILNPGDETVADIKPIDFETVRKSRKRRELLDNYVVAVVNTGTRRGQQTHRLFKSPTLPRVVVIDKQQKIQLFKTSEKLYGQLWTTILETYREGKPLAPTKTAARSSKGDGSRPAYRLQRTRAFCAT